MLIRFLQGHRKLKLPPCGEFQSRMGGDVIVIVILLRILARMLPLEDTSYKGFIIVRLGDNSVNFGGAKEVQLLYL